MLARIERFVHDRRFPAMMVAFALLATGCTRPRKPAVAAPPAPVRPGIEMFVERPPAQVIGKRLGLITNHTGVDRTGRSDIDLLQRMPSVRLVALFSPEHGIRGTAAPGEKVGSSTDEKTGLPVYSLYGDARKPTPEMLKDVDALVFDIQDVGARPYTYVYTMALAMQAAKEKGIPFIVLDRPNPIGGDIIEGNLLDPAFASFVGMYAIPMRHGMTAGELATLFRDRFGIGAQLTVVPVENWRRSTWHDATGLPWVAPSPNLPTLDAALHYPGTVLFEGTNLSCGRGTDHPFEQVGAPWLDAPRVVEAMNAARISGVRFETVQFTPVTPGDKKFPGELLQGVRLIATDRQAYRPVEASVRLLSTIRELHPQQFEWRVSHFDRLAGTDQLRGSIEDGQVTEVFRKWQADAATFRAEREPFLLYE